MATKCRFFTAAAELAWKQQLLSLEQHMTPITCTSCVTGLKYTHCFGCLTTVAAGSEAFISREMADRWARRNSGILGCIRFASEDGGCVFESTSCDIVVVCFSIVMSVSRVSVEAQAGLKVEDFWTTLWEHIYELLLFLLNLTDQLLSLSPFVLPFSCS